ncbi:hypothetical protein AYR47_12685 [Pseudomonas azotoformans]|uniref:Uncharacterized protein n=1 Tax=Pseudomonas azotoformans TaxID=47878 RepID=A0A127HX81_PSEAZ|nr:hypothetical protein AYR47_12685 [Pseudomonas azotoformans]
MIQQARVKGIQRTAEHRLSRLPELIQTASQFLLAGSAQQQIRRPLEIFDLKPEHRQHLIDGGDSAQAFAASGQFVAQRIAPVQVFAEQAAESTHGYTSLMA